MDDADDRIATAGSDLGARDGATARLLEWLLVDGNRLFLAAGFSATVFLLLFGLHELGLVGFLNDDSVTRLAGGMTAGTFSLVTIVVSINQLILSREFGAAGEIRERLGGVLEYREEVESLADVSAAPASPSRFFELLVAVVQHRATRLLESIEDRAGDGSGDRGAALAARYARTAREDANRIEEALDAAEFGTFQALSAVVDYDHGWYLYAARHLLNEHGESLPPEATAAIEDLQEAFGQFGVAQSHFKTTYMQRELTRFSQLVLAVGVPATLAAVLVGLLYATPTGSAVDPAYLPPVASALIAVVFAPLGLLTTYILRTATVIRRTASVGPMLPQKSSDEGPFDVSFEPDRDDEE